MTQKIVNFENPLVKTLLARNFKVKERDLKHFVLPQVGDTLTLGNVIYQVGYVRENPFRFSCNPIGILTDEEFEKALSEPAKIDLTGKPLPTPEDGK